MPPSTGAERGDASQLTAPGRATIEIGRSVLGAPIVAHCHRVMRPRAVVLVVGAIHGSEPDTADVCSAILADTAARPSVDVETWVVPIANPDGRPTENRRNARGVDLNRNFPHRWSPADSGGPRPASEPETRALMSFVDDLRPDVTVWIHQAEEYVAPIAATSSALADAWRRAPDLRHGHWVDQRGGAESWCGFVQGIPTLLVEAASSFSPGGIDVVGHVRGHRALVAHLRATPRRDWLVRGRGGARPRVTGG